MIKPKMFQPEILQPERLQPEMLQRKMLQSESHSVFVTRPAVQSILDGAILSGPRVIAAFSSL